jgi:hypothetical protein
MFSWLLWVTSVPARYQKREHLWGTLYLFWRFLKGSSYEYTLYFGLSLLGVWYDVENALRENATKIDMLYFKT